MLVLGGVQGSHDVREKMVAQPETQQTIEQQPYDKTTDCKAAGEED